jgi:putative transcriptional regulator
MHKGLRSVGADRSNGDGLKPKLARVASVSPGVSLHGKEPEVRSKIRPVFLGPESAWPRQGGGWQTPLLVPIQLQDPSGLGAGKVLVSSRRLGDPLFARTVILLVRYDRRSVLGLVLNRRSKVPISRVFDLKAARDRSDPVYLGGPVQPSVVFALMQSPVDVKKAERVFGQVYLISEKSLFEKTLASRPDPAVFHVYLGYAGWTQQQLQAEVRMGAWFIFPARADEVFNSDPEALWSRMIRETELESAQVEPLPGTGSPRDGLERAAFVLHQP